MNNISTLLITCLTLLSVSKVYAQEVKGLQQSTSTKTEKPTKYALHGRLAAQDGKGNDLAKILLEAAALMENAKGCYLYVVGIDPNNPDEIWVTEIWESKEDHDNSLKAPEVRALIGKAIPILNANQEKGQEWKILGGVGVK